MILPVALLSACFLISASLGSEEISEEEVPLPNINNLTTSKTQTIDPCPRDQREEKVFREIQLPGSDLFKVACYKFQELGSGWLRVYHKLSISPIFTNGTYEDYERGFGVVGTDMTNEFFIGLNRLDHLTSGNPHEVFLSTTFGLSRCDNFVLGNRSEGYKVKSIGNCTGDDVWMNPKQGSKFSTFDRDEDGVPDRNLAHELDFGWWFDPSMSTIPTTIRSTETYSRYGFVVFIRRTD
ncbi:fibrinogen alpha chain-like [Drosophila bipectinata]|uniref:fibrinogen alpha chain-like n=1 Tax=Drosophila bipectinata TaxID=42026 RepID=UPI0038B25EE8